MGQAGISSTSTFNRSMSKNDKLKIITQLQLHINKVRRKKKDYLSLLCSVLILVYTVHDIKSHLGNSSVHVHADDTVLYYNA